MPHVALFKVGFTILTAIIIVYALIVFLKDIHSDTSFLKDGPIKNEHTMALTRKVNKNLWIFNSTLDAILIERAVGQPGHEVVRKFIVDDLKGIGWQVDLDSFNDSTPIGVMEFHNIIASHNPKAKRFLDLACHYDSKLFNKIKFVGATDSAVPCAIMIQLAHSLNDLLTKHANDDLSLRLLFFDGEEAFVSWSEKDSIYGSRHLAKKWQREPYLEGEPGSSQLDRMDLLVLLDLLGTRNPSFFNFFPSTQPLYKLLVYCESKLKSLRLLELGENGQPKTKEMFHAMSTSSSIEDDHLPFLYRGVPVLHLIPVPFPSEWHTKGDNKSCIHFPTVNNLIRILGMFVAEYLHLTT